MEHIKFEQIQSYIEKQVKESDLAEIEGHIAVCSRCNEIYLGLKSLEAPLSRAFGESTAQPSCPEDWEIAALVREELAVKDSDKITTHMSDCDFCIDRAAHYYGALSYEAAPVKTPEMWKQNAIRKLSAAHRSEETEGSFIQRISSFFTELASPFPAAGFAAALLAIAVVAWIIIPGKTRFTAVTALHETVVLRSSEIPQSFGFTGTGETREVKNMVVTLNGKEILFQWEPIEGATAYEFSLKDKNEPVYREHVDGKSAVSVNIDLIEDDRPYSWLITGRTADNRYFEYSGDLIFAR